MKAFFKLVHTCNFYFKESFFFVGFSVADDLETAEEEAMEQEISNKPEGKRPSNHTEEVLESGKKVKKPKWKKME